MALGDLLYRTIRSSFGVVVALHLLRKTANGIP